MDQSTEHEGGSHEEISISKSQKVRAGTMMHTTWARTNQVEVIYDDHGNWCGGKATELSNFIGTIARKSNLLPIDKADWNLMDNNKIEDAWAQIAMRFTHDQPNAKSMIIRDLSGKWNAWRSKIKEKYFKSDDRRECLNGLADPRVAKDQFIALMELWKTEKKKREAEQNAQNRSKQKIMHTLGTKSIPRKKREMEEERNEQITRTDMWVVAHTHKDGQVMESAKEKLIEIKGIRATESSLDSNSRTGPNDPLSQAGFDRHGRLAAMGFGVTAKSAWGSHASTISGSTPSSKDRQIEELQSTIQMLRSNDETRAKEIDDMRATMKALVESMKYSQSQSGNANIGGDTNLHARAFPRKCKLLNQQNKVVGEGTLASTDPNALVHHIPLGLDVWKVWVNVALEPRASLWRPTLEMTTIQHAVGSTVAWHKELLSFD